MYVNRIFGPLIVAGASLLILASIVMSQPWGGGETGVEDDAYNASTWDGNGSPATKNSLRDKIETLGSGDGDVVGPGSSTDNAVPRFHETTGKIVQDSGIIVDDSDNMTGVVGITGTGNFITTGELQGLMDVTADTDATIALAASDTDRAMRLNGDADVIQYTLPGAAAGLMVCFYDNAGGVISLDPADGTDYIVLDGTSVGAGDEVDSPGAAGDFICLLGIDATVWITVGRAGTWVDGGAS